MAAVVERRQQARLNSDLVPIQNKWFVGRLPTGEKLGVSISQKARGRFNVMDDTQGRISATRTSDRAKREARSRARCPGYSTSLLGD